MDEQNNAMPEATPAEGMPEEQAAPAEAPASEEAPAEGGEEQSS